MNLTEEIKIFMQSCGVQNKRENLYAILYKLKEIYYKRDKVLSSLYISFFLFCSQNSYPERHLKTL